MPAPKREEFRNLLEIFAQIPQRLFFGKICMEPDRIIL